MQSKLPVRINRRHILEKKECECDCNKVFRTMLKSSSDGVCNFCLSKGLSSEEILSQCTKHSQYKMPQVKTENIFTNHTDLLMEVKQILSHINTNLEAILLLLKDRKEYFYKHLQDNNIKSKKIKGSDRKEKLLIKTQPYRWPDISRFYWQPSFCTQNFNHPHKPNDDTKGFVFCPFRRNIIYTDKPLSCPNINYFQTMGKIFDKNSISISMYSFPIITLSNQLDNDDLARNKKERSHSFGSGSLRNSDRKMNGSDPKSRDQSEERQFRGQRERDRRETERSLNDSDSNMSGSQEVLPVNNADGNMYVMGSVDSVMMNMFMNPFMGMNIVPPMLTPGDPPIIMNPVKEIIHCKSCTLFPPNPHAPAPTTRERPPGCRTVFVGGLPEKISEEIIHEIFERCGEISTLRLSKKNFCHIRFVFEASVDAAIFLSGYRVRIGSNIDAGHTGRLHVDYAQARDDQYEWECRQRQLQREQRHRERMEEERLKRSSPPPVIHYTDHEASNVAEKIKQDDTFTKAVQIVITWLERGDCNKKNANNFYSMIQSTNSHIRRLLNEKSHYEEELKKAKDLLKGRMQGILLQFSHIERLFMAAHHKKVWDHFTKAQRKNIEAWKKQSLEIKNFQLEDLQEKPKDDDEMDVSDDDEPIKKKPRDASTEERNNLKDENDSLKCQVEAYKNEVEVLKMDYKKDLDDKEKQFKMLQQTLQGMQQQLMEAKRKQLEEEQKVKELEMKLKIDRAAKISEVITLDDDDVEQSDNDSVTEVTSRPGVVTVSGSDAKLIGVISTFLNVHPFGASLDYIWSYVSKIEPNLRPSDIESLMNRFPSVFKQELVGIGANIERKWIFNAFHIVQRYNSSNKNKEINE